MTTWKGRASAWVGVVIFTGSALALSVAVILQQVMTNNNSSNTSNTSNPNSNTQTCTDSSTSEPTLPTPSPYIPSGSVTSLQETDLQVGSGQTAKDGDCLVVKYYGALASNGKEFDQNFTDTTAFAFTLGQGQVIHGWDQGLVGMRVGGIRRLVIPANLAYGSQSRSAIPANSSLVFVVKLLRIQS